MQVKVKKLRPDATLPKHGSTAAAGYDLYAAPEGGQPVDIAPHGTAMIGTGLAFAIPAGHFGGVFARSGLASKQGLRPANCVGVIDCGYIGEVTVKFRQHLFAKPYDNGDRVAQMIIMPYPHIDFVEVDELSESDRGEGGYGSTGK